MKTLIITSIVTAVLLTNLSMAQIQTPRTLKRGQERDGGGECFNSRAVFKAATQNLSEMWLTVPEEIIPPNHKGLSQKQVAQIIHQAIPALNEEDTFINPDGLIEGREFKYERTGESFVIKGLKSYFYGKANQVKVLPSFSNEALEEQAETEIKILKEVLHPLLNTEGDDANLAIELHRSLKAAFEKKTRGPSREGLGTQDLGRTWTRREVLQVMRDNIADMRLSSKGANTGELEEFEPLAFLRRSQSSYKNNEVEVFYRLTRRSLSNSNIVIHPTQFNLDTVYQAKSFGELADIFAKESEYHGEVRHTIKLKTK
jgi:hypothetical protein